AIAGQCLFALLAGGVAQPDDQAGGPSVVARLDSKDVLARPEVLAHIEAVELLPAITAADGDAVDPDGEGVVGGDVELGLRDYPRAGPVDGEGAAEVAR